MTYFFHLLHSLINMGKEMSTLHTLIFTHWFLHFHLPITHTSTQLLTLAPSIIKWIHIYPKSLFIEKFFYSFPLFFFQNFSFWIQTFGLYAKENQKQKVLVFQQYKNTFNNIPLRINLAREIYSMLIIISLL